MRSLLTFLAVLVLGVSTARGQDAPVVKAPCDPAKTACATFQGWLITERIWDDTAATRDLVGARLQAEVRFASRWRVGVRGDATGVPGEFNSGDIKTVRAVLGQMAVAYDAFVLPGVVSLGPAVGFGGEVTTEKGEDGVSVGLPRRMTYGAGLRASGAGWWAYAVVGSNQALPRVAVTTTWQVALSDRVASVGEVAACPGHWTAKTGIAVRWK